MHQPPYSSVRVGDWKAVRQKLKPRGKNAKPRVHTELYNLKEDFSQSNDVADEYPEKLELSKQQYLLAALADEVWLNPRGTVWIDGFAAYRQFYREGLEKLEVEVNLFRVGKYKSAMEPFIRDDMSPEAKEANLHWIGDLWYQYLEAVSRHRGVPADNLAASIDQFADRLEAADGDFARLALDMGLVDQLISRPEANLEMATRGAAGKGSEGYRQVSHDNYLSITDLQQRPAGDQRLQLAEGDDRAGEGDRADEHAVRRDTDDFDRIAIALIRLAAAGHGQRQHERP